MFANKKAMVKYCPIINERIDERLVRINSALVFSSLALFAITGINLILYFVLFDFTIRVVGGIKYSPICKLIRFSLNLGGFKPNLINAAPKKMAAKFGLLFSILIIVFNLLGYNIAMYIVLSIFITASFLEAIFNFCMICKIYPYMNKIGIY